MKKKALSLILAVCMMLTMMPSAIAASVDVSGGEETCSHEAAIGTTHYDTFEEAVEAAGEDQTVTLLNDAETALVEIKKPIQIDGQGHTLWVERLNVYDDTTIENLKIVRAEGSTQTTVFGVHGQGSNAPKVLLKDCEIVQTGTNHGLRLDASAAGAEVTLDHTNVSADTNKGYGQAITMVVPDCTLKIVNGSQISADYYYGIICFSDNNRILVEDSTVSGWCALYLKYNDEESTGSNNTVEFVNSTINGTCKHAYGISNSFAALVFEGGSNNTVTVDQNSKVIATGGENTERIANFQMMYGTSAPQPENNTLNLLGTAQVMTPQTTNGFISYNGNEASATTNKVVIADTTKLLSADGTDAWIETDDEGNFVNAYAVPAEASVDGKPYETLTQAIAAAQNGQTVTLLQDVQGSITIAAGKTLTLDLGGKTLTSQDNHAILNQGNLTIRDSVGGGAVVCPAAGKSALQNEPGATAVIESGKLYKNRNADSSDYYVITNPGTLTIEGGEIVSDSVNSSAIENGWYTPSQNTGEVYAKLTITGGTVSNSGVTANGGLYTLKNDDYGIMEIHGGTFSNTVPDAGTILNWNELTITGGTFQAQNAAVATMAAGTAGNPTYAYEQGKTTVSGGQFDGIFGTNASYSAAITVEISGGDFTIAPPDACLKDGYTTVISPESGYTYRVAQKTVTEVPVEPTVEEPNVPTKEDLVDAEIPEDEIENVINAAASVTVPELGTYANTVANQLTDEQASEAAKQLEDAGLVTEGQATKVYVQTYLEIEPKAYSTEADQLALTFDITPMYRTVASTAETAEDVALEGDTPNAVVFDEGEMEVEGTVEITMTLPDSFTADAQNLYVKHEAKSGTYYYKATVQNKQLSFTNPHGFSTFTVLNDARSAVVSYGEYANEATYTAEHVGQTLPTVQPTSSRERFSGWQFEGIDGTYSTLTDALLTALDTAYTDTAIAATPVFSRRSSNNSSTYSVEIQAGKGGEAKADSARASKGTTITVTTTADEGYVVDEVSVTDANGDEVSVKKAGEGKYTFTMPASNVEVEVLFAEEGAAALPFRDVAENAWYYEAVKYVYDQDIMNGVSDSAFAPEDNLNRAMIAQVLYNLEQQPAVEGDAFDDVASGAWYYEAVTWAAENQIVEGFGDGTFGPTKAVTREQLAAILFRYAQYKGLDAVTTEENLTGFADGDQVSDWAVSAMNWAVGQGIVNGKGNSTLDPQGTASRAEVAKMLMVYLELK